jgi:hypothetical protein
MVIGMFLIYFFSLIIGIMIVAHTLISVDKCPKCRKREWDTVREHIYYTECECRNCGHKRNIQ